MHKGMVIVLGYFWMVLTNILFALKLSIWLNLDCWSHVLQIVQFAKKLLLRLHQDNPVVGYFGKRLPRDKQKCHRTQQY